MDCDVGVTEVPKASWNLHILVVSKLIFARIHTPTARAGSFSKNQLFTRYTCSLLWTRPDDLELLRRFGET